MKCSQFLRLLKSKGWYIVRQKGSHITMRHNEVPGQIVFANHGSQELGKGAEAKLRKIAGLNPKK